MSAAFWLFVAVATDTAFYTGPAATTSFTALFQYIRTVPIITPINNLLYNTKASNLKQHGLHPHYQHILVNLPQLLGPALLLLLPRPFRLSSFSLENMLHNNRMTAAITGTVILSIIPHQEPRFLLPCIPLILTCVQLPDSKTWRNRFWIAWGIFNGIMAVLMGVYHQGGVISAQLAMPSVLGTSLEESKSDAKVIDVYWWKTYPPSLYMLGDEIHNPVIDDTLDVTTTPLLGANRTVLHESLTAHLPRCDEQSTVFHKISNVVAKRPLHEVFLVAPFSAFRFDTDQVVPSTSNFSFALTKVSSHKVREENDLLLTHLETFRQHINLDDMDFADDGLFNTLKRVIGRRGLGIWKVTRDCSTATGRELAVLLDR
jgi:GPI mannosyltransferase 4